MSSLVAKSDKTKLFKLKFKSRDKPPRDDPDVLKEVRFLTRLNDLLRINQEEEKKANRDFIVSADDLIVSMTPFNLDIGLTNLSFSNEDARDAAIRVFERLANDIVPGMSFYCAIKGEGGITLDERDDLKCRFYENKFPVPGETVMVHVATVDEIGADVELIEYNNIKGLIQISDLSKSRMRSVNAHIQEDKIDIAQVQRVQVENIVQNASGAVSNSSMMMSSSYQLMDPSKPIIRSVKYSIDLAKKTVEKSDREQCLERYHKSNQFHLVLKVVADLNKEYLDKMADEINITRPSNEKINTLECLYEKIGWPLYRQCKDDKVEYKHPYDALKIIAFSAKAKLNTNDMSKKEQDRDNDNEDSEGSDDDNEEDEEEDDEVYNDYSSSGGNVVTRVGSSSAADGGAGDELSEDKPDFSPVELKVFKFLLADPELVPLIISLLDYVKTKLAPKAMNVISEIELTCYSYAGIDAVIEALHAGEAVSTPDIMVSTTYKAAPLYRVTAITLDKDQGLAMCNKAIDEIKRTIEQPQYRGSCEIKLAPEVITSEADLELMNTTSKLIKENNKGEDPKKKDKEKKKEK